MADHAADKHTDEHGAHGHDDHGHGHAASFPIIPENSVADSTLVIWGSSLALVCMIVFAFTMFSAKPHEEGELKGSNPPSATTGAPESH